MKKINAWIAALLISCSTLHAQNFKWESGIDSVKADGFHNILLLPAVSSQLTPGYPDLRLYDHAGQEIPYLVRQEVAETDVLQIGTEQYITVPVVSTAQTDSAEDKKTYFRIALDAFHYVDKLELVLSGPAYYRRTAGIYERIVDSANWEEPVTWEYIQSLSLVSGEPVISHLPGFRSRELFVIIDNEDNAPLRIKDLKLSQLRRYITADLKQGEKYTLKLGDVQLNAPVYDLRYFEKNIPAMIPEVSSGPLVQLDPKTDAVDNPQAGASTSKIILWVVLGLVVVLLTWLSVKMVRDMNKEK